MVRPLLPILIFNAHDNSLVKKCADVSEASEFLKRKPCTVVNHLRYEHEPKTMCKGKYYLQYDYGDDVPPIARAERRGGSHTKGRKYKMGGAYIKKPTHGATSRSPKPFIPTAKNPLLYLIRDDMPATKKETENYAEELYNALKQQDV